MNRCIFSTSVFLCKNLTIWFTAYKLIVKFIGCKPKEEDDFMLKYQLGDADARFAELIWNHEPISSGDLVKLCEQEMSWKKSTVYTELRKLCNRGIFSNTDSIVTSKISHEEFARLQSTEFIEENFKGSLPVFLTAFMGNKKISKKQEQELKKLIDRWEE